MKNLLKLSLAALISLMGMSANAQSEAGGLSFGVKGGVNFAGFTGKGAKEHDGKIGFNAGVFAEYVFTENVYLLSGLELTTKGAKAEVKEGSAKVTATFSPMYLQLPIHVGYRLGLSEGINLGVHVGPYLAYGIGGKQKYESTGFADPEDNEKQEIDFFGSKEKGGAKSFDFGLGLGADLDVSKFRIGLGYDLGLSNLSRSDDKDYTMKNRNFYIGVGYRF